MSEERSQKLAPHRATLLSNTHHLVNSKPRTELDQCRSTTRKPIQEKDPQEHSSTPAPMKCWTCNQPGHRKLNCPQTACFFCGRSGHLKRTCLLYRLAKMYDEEKNSYSCSSPSAGTFDLADQEPDTNNLISIDHPQNSSADQSRDKSAELDNLLEASRTQLQKSEEKLSANQIKEPLNVAQSIQILVQDHLKAVQEIKERLCAKATLQETIHSQKTCSQCPSCKHLSLSRKEALIHFQTYHPHQDSHQVKFPRLKLRRETPCAKCKISSAYNLINLNCSNEMCESCIVDLIYCKEMENTEGAWEFQFFIRCPYCKCDHQVDTMAATLLFELSELPLPISNG